MADEDVQPMVANPAPPPPPVVGIDGVMAPDDGAPLPLAVIAPAAANAQMGQQPVVAAPGVMDHNAVEAVNPAAAAAAAAALAGLGAEVAPGAMVQNAALSVLDELAQDYAANALQSEFISNMKRIRKEWYIVMDAHFGAANVPPVNTKKYYEFHANILESLHQIADQEHDNQAGRGTGAATVAIERLASQQILDLFGIDDITKILPLLKRLFPTFIGRIGVEDGISDFISWAYEASPQVKLNVGDILAMYTQEEIDSYFGADANTPAKKTERKEKAWKIATTMFSSSTLLEFNVGGMTPKKKAIIAEIYLMAIFRTIDVCSRRELYFTIDAMISGFLKDLLKHIGLLGGFPIHLRTDKNKCDSAPSGTYIGITPTEKSQLQGAQGAFYIEPISDTVDVNANTTYIKTSFDDLRKTVDGPGYTPDGNASLPLIYSRFLFNNPVGVAEGGGIPLLYGGGAPPATPHSSFVDDNITITIHYDTQRVTDAERIAKMRNPEIIPVEEQRIITVGGETQLFEGVVVCTIQSDKFAEGAAAAAAAAAAAGGDDLTIKKYEITIYKSTDNLTAAASPSKCGMTVDQISRLILLCENMRPYKTIIEFLVTKGIIFDPFIQKELRNLCLNAFNANQKILTGDGGSISVSDKALNKLLGDDEEEEDAALEGGMQIKMVGGADVLTTLADALYVYEFPRTNHTPAIKAEHIERIKGYLTEYESEAFRIPDDIKVDFKERMGRFFDEYTANALDYREVFNALIDAGCTIDQLQKFALAIKFCGDLTQIEGKHSFEKAFESLCVLFSIDRLCCKKNWKSGKNSYTRTNDNFLYLEQGDLPGNAGPEKKKEAEIASTINDILAKSACNANIAEEIRMLSAADGNQQLLRRNVWVNLFGPASNTPIVFDGLEHPFVANPILRDLRATVVQLAAHAVCYKCIMDRNAVRTLDGTIFLPEGIDNLTQPQLLRKIFTEQYDEFFDVNGYLLRDLPLEQLDVIYHELEMRKIEDNNRNNLVKAILYRLFGNESPWSVQKTKKGYKSTRLDLQMFDGRRVLSVQSHNIDLGAIYNALNEMHIILQLPNAPVTVLNDKIAELAGSIKKFFNNTILSMGAFACPELLPPVLRGILFEVNADIDTILPRPVDAPDARSIISQFNLLVFKLLNAFKVEILASTEQNGELNLTDTPILELAPILPEEAAVAAARQAALERLTTARDEFAQINKDFKEQQRILGQELNKLLSLCTKKPIKTTQAQMSKNVQDVFPDINMKLNFVLDQIAKLDNLRANNTNKYYSTNFKTYVLKQLKKFKDAKANDTYKFVGILAYRATFYDNCIRLLESYLERITKRITGPAAVFPRSIPLVVGGPPSIRTTKKTGRDKKEYIKDEHAAAAAAAAAAPAAAAAAINEDEEEPEESEGGINPKLQQIIQTEYNKMVKQEHDIIASSDVRTENITEKVPIIRARATVRKKNSPPTIKVKATSGILTNMMKNAKKLLKKYIKNKGSLPNKRDTFNSSIFDAIIGVYQNARREAAAAAAEARRAAAAAAAEARRAAAAAAAAKARREAAAAAAETKEAEAENARRKAIAAAAPAVAAAKARREAAAAEAAADAAAEAAAAPRAGKKGRVKGGYDTDLQYGGVNIDLRYASANYSNDDIGYTYEDNDILPEDSLALLECLAYLLLDANGEPSKAIVDEEIIESIPLNIEEIKENYMYTLQQIPLNIYSNGRVSSVEQLILRESDILQFIHYILRELDGNGSFERLNIELAKESETISANLKDIVELTKEIYTTVSSIINKINSSKDPFDAYNTFIDKLSDAFNNKEPTHSTMDILLKAFPLSEKGNSTSAAKNNSKNAPVIAKSNSTIAVAVKNNTKNAVAPIVINSNSKNATVSTTVAKNNTQEQSATILNLQPTTKSSTRNKQRSLPNRPKPSRSKPSRSKPSQSTKQKSRTNPNLTIADPNLVPPSTTLSVIQSAQPEFREQSQEQFKRPIQSQGQSYQPEEVPVNGGWSTRKRRRQYKKKSRKQKQ